MKLPRCSSSKSWTDFGYEYDREAIHGMECDNCLACYDTVGGLWHPYTGKKVNRFIAFILYGVQNRVMRKEYDGK